MVENEKGYALPDAAALPTEPSGPKEAYDMLGAMTELMAQMVPVVRGLVETTANLAGKAGSDAGN